MEKKNSFYKIMDLIYSEYKQYLDNICYSILKDYHSAQDAVQDALIYIYKLVVKGYIDYNNFDTAEMKSLIATITKCRAINIYRKKSKAPLSIEESSVIKWQGKEVSRSIDEQLIEKEKTESIFSAMLDLPPIYSETLVLFYRYEFSRAEIAKMLGISYNATRLRIARGNKILVHYLTTNGISPYG